jgi:N-acetylglucosamine-6-phosphate deacetylase
MAKQIRLLAHRLFDGNQFLDNQVLTCCDGKIVGIDNQIDLIDSKLEGLVVPGFIDLQVNGGGGILFNRTPTLLGLQKIVTAHQYFGSTALLPTIITDELVVMEAAADVVAKAINTNLSSVLGIHFEGPHISIAKKGAHSADYIREISDKEWQIYQRKDIGQIMVTLAPENTHVDDIKRLVSLGIKVCIGHSNASFDIAEYAILAGADGFTHLFNAMSPLQGREPGVVGAALLNDQASCGLIVDGHHVDYQSCKLALKIKPKGRVFLVTDAMPPVGTTEQGFDFFNRYVSLQHGKLISSTGELAGSVLDMATAVRNTYSNLDVSLGEAIKMATLYPACYIKQEHIRGRLAIGFQADFTVLDDCLRVKETWVSGTKVY